MRETLLIIILVAVLAGGAYYSEKIVPAKIDTATEQAEAKANEAEAEAEDLRTELSTVEEKLAEALLAAPEAPEVAGVEATTPTVSEAASTPLENKKTLRTTAHSEYKAEMKRIDELRNGYVTKIYADITKLETDRAQWVRNVSAARAMSGNFKEQTVDDFGRRTGSRTSDAGRATFNENKAKQVAIQQAGLGKAEAALAAKRSEMDQTDAKAREARAKAEATLESALAKIDS